MKSIWRLSFKGLLHLDLFQLAILGSSSCRHCLDRLPSTSIILPDKVRVYDGHRCTVLRMVSRRWGSYQIFLPSTHSRLIAITARRRRRCLELRWNLALLATMTWHQCTWIYRECTLFSPLLLFLIDDDWLGREHIYVWAARPVVDNCATCCRSLLHYHGLVVLMVTTLWWSEHSWIIQTWLIGLILTIH